MVPTEDRTGALRMRSTGFTVTWRYEGTDVRLESAIVGRAVEASAMDDPTVVRLPRPRVCSSGLPPTLM